MKPIADEILAERAIELFLSGYDPQFGDCLVCVYFFG